jgi:peptide/nickel transport system substrate-binding protein
MWARSGIRARLVSEPMATFIAKVLNFEASAYMLGVSAPTYDAQFTWQSLVRTRVQVGADGNLNYGRMWEAGTIDAPATARPLIASRSLPGMVSP